MITNETTSAGFRGRFAWRVHYSIRPIRPASPDAEFITGGQLLLRYGKATSNRMFLTRLREGKQFPEPYYFGSNPMWKLSEIEAWEQSRKAGA